jgi:hypothetical protein
MSSRPEPGSARHLIELIVGYGLIVFILWMPEFPQRILSPVALFVTLAIVLAIASVLVAKQVGTLHALYKSDFKHVAGYVLWTLYQQFLLNDYFMPRLIRLLVSESALWARPQCCSRQSTCPISRSRPPR